MAEARRGGRRVYMEDGRLCAADKRPELYGGSALLAGPLSARQQRAPALGEYTDLTDARLPDGQPGLPSWDPTPGLHRARGVGGIANGALFQSAYLRAGAGATAGTAANPVDGFLLPTRGRRGQGGASADRRSHLRKTVMELAKLGLDAEAMRGAGTMAHAFLGGGSPAHTLRTNAEAAASLKARVGIRENLEQLERANSAMSLSRASEESRGLVSRGSQGSVRSPFSELGGSRRGTPTAADRSWRGRQSSAGSHREDAVAAPVGELEELTPREERSSGVHAASPRVRSGDEFYSNAEEAEASAHATQWALKDPAKVRRVSADGTEGLGDVSRGVERYRARSRSPESTRPRDGAAAVAQAASMRGGRRPARELNGKPLSPGIFEENLVMQEADASSLTLEGTLLNGQSFVASTGLIGRDLKESNREARFTASGVEATSMGNKHVRREAKMGGGFKVGVPREIVTQKTASLRGVNKPIVPIMSRVVGSS